MSGAFGSVFANILNLRMLFWALALVSIVLLVGYVTAKNKKARRKKPGQYLRYTSPTRTAKECLDLLSHRNVNDLFTYKMEDARAGGWYITFTGYIPTEQIMETVFLFTFETETPALFTLSFVREAFGMREPVMPEAMLDAFFEKKLDAQRVYDQD